MALRTLAPILLLLALLAPATASAEPRAKRSALAADARAAERALSRVGRLDAGSGVRTGREVTHALHDLALRLPALDGPGRREGESRLARPTDRGADPFGDGYPAEAPVARICRSGICVHYVADAAFADAPPGGISYANQVLDVLEEVQAVEQGQLGWRAPLPDAGIGGGPEVDAYVKQLGGQGIFGYAATDPGQSGNSRHAFLVLDNDYSPSEFPGYASPLDPLRVTAAHEYNHLIHYAIDTFQDFWLFESSAVWMEDRVYDAVNDYLNYLPPPRWTAQTRVPLTRFNPAVPADPGNVKVYGSAVWNHWLAARFGPEVVRATWEGSLGTSPPSFAPGAYDAALRPRGSTFSDEFARFALAVAEWRVPGAGFPEGASYPDVERLAALGQAAPDAALAMDHTTFTMVDVAPGSPAVTLAASFPRGTAAAVGLIGREGPDGGGALVSDLAALPAGGRGTVSLPAAAGLTRITAVLVNADVSHSGYDQGAGEWRFIRDGQCVTATIAPDGSPPSLRLEPRATGVSLTGPVTATFSEPVACFAPQAVQLIDPRGRTVLAAVRWDQALSRMTVTPSAPLRDSATYRVRVDDRVVDLSGNPAAPAEVTFKTVRRPPAISLAATRRQSVRRGVEVRLRSGDPDTLRYAIGVSAPRRSLSSRVVGSRRGRIAAGRTLTLRIPLSRAARAVIRSGRSLRLSVTARATDPAGNSARRRRTILARGRP